MTYRWISYVQRYSYGKDEISYIELDIPEKLNKPKITKKDQELIDLIGSELEHLRILNNWGEHWRGVDLQFAMPPREKMLEEVSRAKSRLQDEARRLARYEAQLAEIPPERLPESRL